MSKKPIKAKSKRPAPKTAILYGLDKDNKPHAARFTGENEALLARAAGVMGLRIAVPATQKHFELTSKLPAGKIHATGNALVPIIDQSLYDQIVTSVGGQPGAVSATLPKSLAQLAPGHVVIALDSFDDGWFPAVVIKRSGETVTLKWRDYPGEAEIIRPISGLALLNAD